MAMTSKGERIFLHLPLIILLLPNCIHPWVIYSKSDSFDNNSSSENQPIFVAHRGDKFLLPEHTIAAYDVAMLTNVDFVEPDLVMTRDGVLVCYHDITLRDGTDVTNHPEFAALMTQNKTLFLDGKNVTIVDDWLIADFTQAQLSTLRVNQKGSQWRPQYFNGYYGIPTFQQYLDAVHRDTWRRLTKGEITNGDNDFVMGIIPELKHPSYHNNDVFHSDYRMEKDFLAVLKSNGYLDNQCRYNNVEIPCSPLVVQCFQVKTINYLNENSDLTLLTLLDTQNLRYLTQSGMLELANKTTYVSLWKELLYTGIEMEVIYKNVTYDKDEVERLGGFIAPQDVVSYAHALGLKVGIYTIYHSEEKSWRGCAVKCETDVTKEEELEFYLDMGVDAFFVEGLSESLRIRDRWLNRKSMGTSGGDTGLRKHNVWILLVGVAVSGLTFRV